MLIPIRLLLSFFRHTVPGTVGIPLLVRLAQFTVTGEALFRNDTPVCCTRYMDHQEHGNENTKQQKMSENSQLVFLQFVVHVCEHYRSGAPLSLSPLSLKKTKHCVTTRDIAIIRIKSRISVDRWNSDFTALETTMTH